jgi:hypothetical protein
MDAEQKQHEQQTIDSPFDSLGNQIRAMTPQEGYDLFFGPNNIINYQPPEEKQHETRIKRIKLEQKEEKKQEEQPTIITEWKPIHYVFSKERTYATSMLEFYGTPDPNVAPIPPISVDFDKDLCYYTLEKGRTFIFNSTTLPSVIVNIVLDYSAIYRDDHMSPYVFTVNDTHKSFLEELVQPRTNENRITCIATDRRGGRSTLLMQYLLYKEIECKESGISFNARVISTGSRSSAARSGSLQKLRSDTKERWMVRDTLHSNPYVLSTRNNFKVSFVVSRDKRFKYRKFDCVITDDYTFVAKLLFNDIMRNATQVILTDTIREVRDKSMLYNPSDTGYRYLEMDREGVKRTLNVSR